VFPSKKGEIFVKKQVLSASIVKCKYIKGIPFPNLLTPLTLLKLVRLISRTKPYRAIASAKIPAKKIKKYMVVLFIC
jgi:hypothetical protein